ncbi:MAG: 30S ribosomal protein S6e [Thermofilaceae archaeon]|nr:30S ribosomal protein S6e [Thermofilaceae archaeon]MCX8180185.1 30S ribosomal protein S6e [Thermofilaceae archaeon]MDW8004159.1 30S ribosomal protein S6e [Thermofilaceae archaeon]
MPEYRVSIAYPKTGKAEQIEVKGQAASFLLGRRIGDVIDGSLIGKPGLRLKITGGSGKAGEPMLPFLPGGVKRFLILSKPPGYHPKERGIRRRKFVRGNMITEDIVQINMVVLEGGGESAETGASTASS